MKKYKLLYDKKFENDAFSNEDKEEEDEDAFFEKINNLVHFNLDFEDFEYIKKPLNKFIKKSKYKYKIIYKNKIYSLKGLIKIMKIILKGKIKKLTIKLICYKHILDTEKNLDDFSLLDYFKHERLANKKNMNMHKYIDYQFNSSHEIYKMIYHINNKVKIRIF